MQAQQTQPEYKNKQEELQDKVNQLNYNLSAQNALKKTERVLKQEIIALCEEEIAKKDFGVVAVNTEYNKIVFNTPKQVKYDQNALAKIWGEIEHPEQYINIEYDIPESRFKAWPVDLQNLFMDARTVSQGATSVKIELLKGESDDV